MSMNMSQSLSMSMSENTITCEHPTLDRKGLISMPLDLVCVRPHCQHPNRYACEFCRYKHEHNDEFVRIQTIFQFLKFQKVKIDDKVEKANNDFTSAMKAYNKLLKILDNLQHQIQIQQQANYYVQLFKLKEENKISNTKQEIQTLGEILRKITICKKGQLKFISIPVEDKQKNIQKLKSDIEQCVSELFQQLEKVSVQQKSEQDEMQFSYKLTRQNQASSDQINLLLSQLEEQKQQSGGDKTKIQQFQINQRINKQIF